MESGRVAGAFPARFGAVSLLQRGRHLLAVPTPSAVTLAELSIGPAVPQTGAERAARRAHLAQAGADYDRLPIDAATGCARSSTGSSSL